MSTARRLHYTYADYLSIERDSPVRHEYCDGEIYAMAGGTPEHAALAAQMSFLLKSRLPSECRPFSSDLRVRISASDLTTYPDVSVVCGPVERSKEDPLAIVNPALVVEVTSPSTEDYDRGEKLSHYKQLPSLRSVLIVSHREPRLTLWTRETGEWNAREFRGDERCGLAEWKLELTPAEVFSALSGL